MTFQQQLQAWRQRVDACLDQWLPPESTHPFELHKAMRYAVFNGGKRVRPVLVYSAGQSVDADPAQLDAPACAVELIHAYSLVHDDLPAMDDDDLRRGKPTCHKAFNEATAILAGDALQALAFHLLVHRCDVLAELLLRMIDELAVASGSRGMAGGQAIDLASVGKELTLAELENMHIHKTGALIRASVHLGGLAGQADEAHLKKLDHFGKCVGLAFQIQDDILDVECDTETLGKRQGADALLNKPTYPRLLGMQGSRDMAQELVQDALDSLSGFDARADNLRNLARYIIERNH